MIVSSARSHVVRRCASSACTLAVSTCTASRASRVRSRGIECDGLLLKGGALLGYAPELCVHRAEPSALVVQLVRHFFGGRRQLPHLLDDGIRSEQRMGRLHRIGQINPAPPD